jgi:hypothetical protein
LHNNDSMGDLSILPRNVRKHIVHYMMHYVEPAIQEHINAQYDCSICMNTHEPWDMDAFL